MTEYPAQIYAFLQRVSPQVGEPAPENDEAFFEQLAEWVNDQSGQTPPPQRSEEYERCLSVCEGEQLVEYVPCFDGLHLVLTARGRGCLSKWLLANAAGQGEQSAAVEPTPTNDPATILYHGGESYSAGGKPPESVSREQHDFLQAFLKSGRSMTTRELKEAVNNPSKVAKLLKERFPDAVQLPGKTKGKGYFVRVEKAVSTR